MLELLPIVAIGTISMVAVTSDEHQIPVTIPTTPFLDGSGQPHTPAQFLAQGYFDLQSDILSLSFLQSVGFCTIMVVNTAGEIYSDVFDSDCGLFTMGLSGVSGLYTVSVHVGNGSVYMGQFTVI